MLPAINLKIGTHQNNAVFLVYEFRPARHINESDVWLNATLHRHPVPLAHIGVRIITCGKPKLKLVLQPRYSEAI